MKIQYNYFLKSFDRTHILTFNDEIILEGKATLNFVHSQI